MVNYYEILEVSEKASKEVIEKAYKALAKKYHPDLNHENPDEASEKMKLINEAFEVLMDENKKTTYDNLLQKKRIVEQQKNVVSQNNSYNATTQTNSEPIIKNGKFYINTQNMDQKTQNKIKQKLQERYIEAYDAYLRERGYKLKYKWTFKRIIKLILTIIITILILTALFFIPPIHSYFIELYNDNSIIKIFVDTIKSLF